MTKRKSAFTGLAGLLLATALSAPASAQGVEGPVYLLVPNATTIRWTKFDEPNIRAAFARHAPGVELRVLNANGKAAQQVADVDAALASGAIGIILVAVDPSQAGGTIAKAAQDGVPVVTYAHDPGPGPVAYHVSVPFTDIGEAQAEFLAANLPEARPVRLALMLGDPNFKFYHDQMQGFDAVIEPLVAAGEIEIVCRADAMGYLPANAQKNMEQCLTQTDNGVDAAVVMNDDTGGGVLAALGAQGLQGEVKLFGGYDATLEAVQRVLAGWQGATMSPPYEGMADAAAQLTLAAVAKAEPPAGLINGGWDNGFTEGGVPARLEPNVFVTAENVQETVIDAGLYSREEVCAGIAADSAFCVGE
jgi:D-xylose transport system substrate-binding protein